MLLKSTIKARGPVERIPTRKPMSEDACDARGIVFFDNQMDQVSFTAAALATPFRQKVLEMVFLVL
jgi:hypothetical protein